MGVLYEKKGNYELAEKYFVASLKLKENIFSKYILIMLKV